MSANAIEIRGLTKSFPSFNKLSFLRYSPGPGFRLGPIDLTVPAGAIYGFIGPNDAGKTTTIDLIFGMGAKESGSITVLGCDHLRDELAMKRQVGYVSPDLNLRTLPLGSRTLAAMVVAEPLVVVSVTWVVYRLAQLAFPARLASFSLNMFACLVWIQGLAVGFSLRRRRVWVRDVDVGRPRNGHLRARREPSR
jgi:alpha-D-ribose 1-methylphosphonate 5-triphosphate synthase subunit PhnL